MILFLDWILILSIALFILGVFCSAVATVQHLACAVTHLYMRSWSAEMQCPRCGEDVHLARVHSIYFSQASVLRERPIANAFAFRAKR